MQIDQIANKIKNQLKTKQLLAIFDRDGTLVPINPDPKAAILSKHIKNLLLQLSSLPKTQVGILSARSITSLKNDFDQNELILAGNYGMELLLPNKGYAILPSANKSRELLLEVKSEIAESLSKEMQVILEDHELILCLHWHLTPPEHIQTIHNTIQRLKAKFSELLFVTLPTSYEIWPPIQWNKENGLQFILSILNFNIDNYLILYAGDFSSDEPVFNWVNIHDGISIRIGKTSDSHAQFFLDSVKDIEEILQLLIDIRQSIK